MINYLEHHIVDHCNLNCVGCSHFSPIANPWFENIENFKRDFSYLAELTHQEVGIIRLMGGEPLLHPNLQLFLQECRKLFPLTRIELVTNGILIKKLKNQLIQWCNDNYIVICISDYNIFNVSEALEGFKYTRYYGKTDLYNISLDLTGNQDPQYSFNNCDLHINRWDYFQHGRFYPCCIGGNITIFENKFGIKLINNQDEISISIYDHSLDEIESFLNQPNNLCKYCNTMLRQKNYTHFIQSKGDIKEWIYQ